MLLTLPLLPQLFADSVTDSCSSLFHYPCPPPHSSPQYLIAESEVTDQSLHPLGCIWLHGILLYGLPRYFTSFERTLGTFKCLCRIYILAEAVLLKCVANGLRRGINMMMNVAPLQIVVVCKERLRLVYSLGVTNTAKKEKKMYDLRIKAVTTCCYYSVFCEAVFTFQRSDLPLRCHLMWFNPTFPGLLTTICLKTNPRLHLLKWQLYEINHQKKKKSIVKAILTRQSSYFPVYIC